MARTQPSRSIELLVATFVARLTGAVEREIEARTRILTAEYLTLAAPGPSGTSKVPPGLRKTHKGITSPAISRVGPSDVPTDDRTIDRPAAPTRPARTSAQARVTRAADNQLPRPPHLDLQQETSDAEFARLRELLKPTGPEHIPQGPPVAFIPPSALPHAALPDPLRLLEDEIREQVQGLPWLPPSCCTAGIAAWAGRARSYEETSGNRMAAQLLLEKLRTLARAMEAGRIEALIASWHTTDWPSYIRRNEALAEVSESKGHRQVQGESSPGTSPTDMAYDEAWS